MGSGPLEAADSSIIHGINHETTLIATVAAGLGLAFLFGLIAVRFKLPLLIGYLVAGMAVGPFTPGFVADQSIAQQLAEIGVSLLMFGVGLHFSIGDLWAVRKIAIPGALAQIIAATSCDQNTQEPPGPRWLRRSRRREATL